jgi:hypothetical protein
MKKIDIDFEFEDSNDTVMLHEIASGITAISHDYNYSLALPIRRMQFALLSGGVIEVVPTMYDTRDKWDEVGTLVFRRKESLSLPSVIAVDGSFGRPLNITKFLVEEQGQWFASGLSLISDTSREIILVAGELAYSLALCGSEIEDQKLCCSQYVLTRYERINVFSV